ASRGIPCKYDPRDPGKCKVHEHTAPRFHAGGAMVRFGQITGREINEFHLRELHIPVVRSSNPAILRGGRGKFHANMIPEILVSAKSVNIQLQDLTQEELGGERVEEDDEPSYDYMNCTVDIGSYCSSLRQIMATPLTQVGRGSH
ncbi:unnamed protein product, partial [Dovyalis caffra]